MFDYIATKLTALKEKYFTYTDQRKKIKALDNISSCSEIPTMKSPGKFIWIIKEILKEDTLDQKQADFLDHMLKLTQKDYLLWCYRTRYVKDEMSRLAFEKQETQRAASIPQLIFNFEKKRPIPEIPVTVLMGNKNARTGKRV